MVGSCNDAAAVRIALEGGKEGSVQAQQTEILPTIRKREVSLLYWFLREIFGFNICSAAEPETGLLFTRLAEQ